MFFSKPKNILGIDIGTSHIKAVELRPDPIKPFLVSYGMVNVVLPPDATPGTDPIAQVADVLSALHQKAQFTTNRVILSLPSNVAFVSVFDFPKMGERELQNAVEFKAQQFIPLPMTDVNFSWQVLDETPVSSKDHEAVEGKVRVLLTAVPKNVVNNYLQVLQQAKLEPVAIEIESISAIRSLIPPTSTDSVLIVDVGAKSTIVSLVHGGHLFASRHVSVGGDSITSSIAKSLGITFERAEQLKRSPESSDTATPAAALASSVVGLIRNEVQQMILIAENHGKSIAKIILTGGGARYQGFTGLMSDMGPAVEAGNPLVRIAYDPQFGTALAQASTQLSIAIGLALRSAETV